MADDGGIKKTQDLTKATKEAKGAVEEFQGAVKANIENLGAWDTETGQVTSANQALIETLREEADALAKSASQVGSLKNQFTQVTGAARGFINQIAQAVSVGNTYNLLLNEMRQGQETYSKSLITSTAKLGQASAESQRQIDTLHNSYYDAKVRAAEYGLEVDELKKHTEELHSSFAAQIDAMGSNTAVLNKLQKTTFTFSRFMGTSYSQAVQLMNDRMQTSNKTLEEVREEMVYVAREADNWTKKVQTMGDKMQQTGNVTRQGFLKVMEDIRSQFRGGMFDAKTFAKATGDVFEIAKKSGLTPEETQAMATGLGKVIKEMGSMNSIFGARSAQVFGSMLDDLEQIQDETLRKRLEPYAKKFEQTGQLNILDLKAISAATQGSAEGIKILAREMRQANWSPDVMRAEFGRVLGEGQQHIADRLAEMVQAGTVEKDADKVIKAKSKESAETQKKQLDFWEKSLDQLMKEGATATKIQYQTVKELHEFKVKTLAFFEKYPLMMAAVMGGAQMLGGLASKGLGALFGRTAAASGGTSALTASVGSAGLGATAVGVGTAGLAGYMAGTYLDEKIGEYLAEDRETGKLLGKDKTLANLIAIKAGTDLTAKEITRIRGVWNEKKQKELEMLETRIKWAKKNWHKLDESTKRQIKAAEKRAKDLKEHRDKFTRTEEEKRRYDQRVTNDKIQDLIDNFQVTVGGEGVGFKGRKDVKKYIENLVADTGFGKMHDPVATMKALEKKGVISDLAKRAGVESPEIKKMFMQTMAKLAIGGGQAATLELGKGDPRLMIRKFQEWMQKTGEDRQLAFAPVVKEYLEAARSGQKQEVSLKVSSSDAGAGTSGEAPDGSYEVYGTTKIKLKADQATWAMKKAMQRMPKTR
jgi:hypothetical protein